jgi:hypothetical protein
MGPAIPPPPDPASRGRVAARATAAAAQGARRWPARSAARWARNPAVSRSRRRARWSSVAATPSTSARVSTASSKARRPSSRPSSGRRRGWRSRRAGAGCAASRRGRRRGRTAPRPAPGWPARRARAAPRRPRRPHRLAGLVHLDPARADQPRHPDPSRARRQQLADLVLQVALVLPGPGVLHRQRRHARDPARRVRHVAHRHVRRPQRVGRQRVARVDPRGLHRRIGLEHLGPQHRAPRPRPAGRRDVDRVTARQLVPVAAPHLGHVERPGRLRWSAGRSRGHSSRRNTGVVTQSARPWPPIWIHGALPGSSGNRVKATARLRAR